MYRYWSSALGLESLVNEMFALIKILEKKSNFKLIFYSFSFCFSFRFLLNHHSDNPSRQAKAQDCWNLESMSLAGCHYGQRLVEEEGKR